MSVTQPASERVPGLATALRRLAAVVALLTAVAGMLVVANRSNEDATAPATAAEVTTDRARLAESARWQGLADYYAGQSVGSTAATGAVTSAQPGTVGGAPVAPSAPTDASAARSDIWDFKERFAAPLGDSTPAGPTVDPLSYTPFIQRMLGMVPASQLPEWEDGVGSTPEDLLIPGPR